MSKARARPLIRAFLIDISGNLHVGSEPTPDAVKAFHCLRASGIPFRLCSNTSKESTNSVIQRLNELGFKIELPPNQSFPGSFPGDQQDSATRNRPQGRQEVWTSIGAVTQYIQQQHLKRPYLLLTSSAKEEVSSILSAVNDDIYDSSYDSVVVGLAPEVFDYSHINTAFRILKGELSANSNVSGALRKPINRSMSSTFRPPPLIATHKAKYVQTEAPAGLSLGPGPFVTALETAANVRAHVLGKPTKLFFETVINDFYLSGELDKAEQNGKIMIIGDDVEADLGDGAIELGLWRILVKTGKYRAGDESRLGITPPDEVFDSFAECVERVLTEQGCRSRELVTSHHKL